MNIVYMCLSGEKLKVLEHANVGGGWGGGGYSNALAIGFANRLFDFSRSCG